MDNIEKELANKYIQIKKRGWIETERHSDQCLGNTFEDLVGVRENNDSNADYKGIELKAHRNSTGSLVTLFSKSPSYPKGVNTYLRETYGVCEDDFGQKVLNTTVSGNRENTHRGGHRFKINVNRKAQRLELQIRNMETNEIVDDLIYWDFGVLEKALINKIKKIAIFYGDEKDEGSIHFVRYTKMIILEGITLEQLLKSIEDGELYIDIRIGVYHTGKNIGKTHDHGTAFRIDVDKLISTYGVVKEY